MSNNLTYAKSGVNIRSADKIVKFISKLTSKRTKIIDKKILAILGL